MILQYRQLCQLLWGEPALASGAESRSLRRRNGSQANLAPVKTTEGALSNLGINVTLKPILAKGEIKITLKLKTFEIILK